jgi:hypothetical protein
MKLDSEQDRKILLQVMSQAQIPGSAAPVFADLLRRLSEAEVSPPKADERN